MISLSFNGVKSSVMTNSGLFTHPYCRIHSRNEDGCSGLESEVGTRKPSKIDDQLTCKIRSFNTFWVQNTNELSLDQRSRTYSE
jgi:hypothetical protein